MYRLHLFQDVSGGKLSQQLLLEMDESWEILKLLTEEAIRKKFEPSLSFHQNLWQLELSQS
jgi:hypothetical protein